MFQLMCLTGFWIRHWFFKENSMISQINITAIYPIYNFVKEVICHQYWKHPRSIIYWLIWWMMQDISVQGFLGFYTVSWINKLMQYLECTGRCQYIFDNKIWMLKIVTVQYGINRRDFITLKILIYRVFSKKLL